MNTMQMQLQLQLYKLIFIENKHTIHWTVTVMNYVMSWTDPLTFHHDLDFIPLHYTYVPFTSSPQFTSLHFLMISPTTSLRLIYHFPNPFPKIFGLQERVPKASAGS
jgi:hypothetical protein